MGIPGFFATLLRKYNRKKIIIHKIGKDVDWFYIDANCLFHPQCFKVLYYFKETKSREKLEKIMMERIW